MVKRLFCVSLILIAISLSAYAGSSASYIISTEVFNAGAEETMTSSSYKMMGKLREQEYQIESSSLYKLGAGFFNAIFGDLILSPIPTSVSPNSAPNTSAATITINGLNFQTGATLEITKAGETSISGESVTVTVPNLITCTFNIVGKLTGSWNVVVHNPDGRTGTLTDGFTITSAGGKPKIIAHRNYPNPFDPDVAPTKIRYELDRPATIKLSIYSAERRVWYEEYSEGATGGQQGVNEILWNGEDVFSQSLPNGIYLYVITSDKGEVLAKGKIAIFR